MWKKLLLLVAALSLTLSVEAAKGYCGPNVAWVLENDTLRISGKGVMDDYEAESPFIDYKNEIRYLVIAEGVTAIGSRSFAGLDSLRIVSLPVSLQSIGESAFESCISLGEVTIEDNVKKLYPYAFRYCTGLKTVNWNCPDCEMVLVERSAYKADGRDYYPNFSFRGSGVECVNFGKGVKIIPEEIFSEVKSLSTVNFADTIEYVRYCAFDGTAWLDAQPAGMVYIDKCAYHFKPFPEGGERRPLVIKEGTQSITVGAFMEAWHGAPVSELVFPESLRIIGGALCSRFREYPEKVVWNCDSVELVFPVRSGYYEEYFPDDNYPYKITQYMQPEPPFDGFVTDFVFGSSVKSTIKDFLSNVTLTHGLNLPPSLEYISTGMFCGMKGVDSVVLPPYLKSIGYGIFRESSVKKVEIPGLTDSFDREAFADADSLLYVVIGSGVKVPVVFPYAKNLTRIDWNAVSTGAFPEDYMDIRWREHNGDLEVNIGSEVEKIPDSFLKDVPCGLNLTIADGALREIGAYAFQNVDGLKCIDLPSGLKRIGMSAFENTKGLTSVEFPDGLEEIAERAFAGSNIENIFLPSSVRTMGESSFLECALDTMIAAPAVAPSDRGLIGYYRNDLTAPVVYVPSPESYRRWKPDVRPMVCGADGDVYCADGVTPPKLKLKSLIPGYEVECDFVSPYSAPGNYTVSVPVRFIGPRTFETEVSYSYEITDVVLSIDGVEASGLSVETVEGGVIVNGSSSPVSIYDLRGRCLYHGGDGLIRLPRGLYILRAGATVQKIEVR